MKRLASVIPKANELDAAIGRTAARPGRYRDVLWQCLAQPVCKALQTWGFTDKYSNAPNRPPFYGAALLFDENYRPEPAYFAIQDELKKGR